MKTKFYFTAIILMVLQFTIAQNKSRGTLDTSTPVATVPNVPDLPPASTEVFRFLPGLVTQIDTGTGFGFTTTNRWFSIGNLTPSSTSQTLYGFRIQRAGRGLLFGYSGTNQSVSPDVPGNPFIQWVGNNDPATNATPGNLEFRTSTSSTNPASDRLAFTLRSDLTALLGEVSSIQTGQPIPKYEINGVGLSSGQNLTSFLVNVPALGGGTIVKGAIINSVPSLNSNGGIQGNTALEINSNGANPFNYGVKINSSNQANENYGIYSDMLNLNTSGARSTANLNYGIRSKVVSPGFTSTAYGLYGEVVSSATVGSINVGVYGTATGTGTTTVGPQGNYAGYFGGTIYATQGLFGSDKRLKKEIKKEENILDKIALLNPVNYKFNDENKDLRLNLPKELQHGFIAQDLEKVFPELVVDLIHPSFNEKNEQIGTKTLKAVNYTGIISILTESVKELSNQVKELQTKIDEMQKGVNADSTLKSKNSEKITTNTNEYFLGQNTPNPFTSLTEIEYAIMPSAESVKASILILNLNGQIINEYKLSSIKGKITVEASSLQKGVYLYSLVNNGKILDTKKMLIN